MTLYKVLNEDGSSFHGGSGKWFLPQGDEPGEWMPRIADLVPCKRGYHVLKPEMLIHWLGPAIFEVEVRGAEVWEGDKGAVEQARLIRRLERWNDQTARLFACDCAESVVHLVKDERSVNAIRVARRFAFGLASKEELAAAWDTAWDTARAAARAAAGAAARDTARAAAWAAARDTAGAAQTKRLFEYLEGKVNLEAIRRSVA